VFSPIRRKKRKEIQAKQAKKTFTMLIVIERLVEKEFIKQ